MRTRVASLLAGGTLGLGLLTLSPGVATATSIAKPVLSDTIKFAGTAVANSSSSFTFQSSKCSLVSDGETSPFTCSESGQGTMSSTGISGSATVTSSDGTTNWTFTLTPTTTSGQYKLVGKGTENDAPDSSGTPPTTNPCVVRGLVTVTPTSPTTATIKGTEKVFESPTAP